MNQKKIAIVQSNYIPWKGYFDLINSVDEFILYDSEQYTKRDWRNRNLIKTPKDLMWLTIPVESKGKRFQSIQETRVANHKWIDQHINALRHNYTKAAYFEDYWKTIQVVYESCRSLDYLSQINFSFIKCIMDLLGIETQISWSSDFELTNGKNQKLIELCQAVEATHYLSGPAASNYLEIDSFNKKGITVEYFNYEDYPTYNQTNNDFTHHVSILDLIFNTGKRAGSYLKSFGGI